MKQTVLTLRDYALKDSSILLKFLTASGTVVGRPFMRNSPQPQSNEESILRGLVAQQSDEDALLLEDVTLTQDGLTTQEPYLFLSIDHIIGITVVQHRLSK